MAVTPLDRSAVIAYLDEGDALHANAVLAVESAVKTGSTLAISAVTWSELLHGAFLGHHPEAVIRELVQDFGIEVLAVDRDTAEHAMALQAAYHAAGKKRERRRLRTPDALILATQKQHADIDQVVCGDEKWAKVPGIDAGVITLLTEG